MRHASQAFRLPTIFLLKPLRKRRFRASLVRASLDLSMNFEASPAGLSSFARSQARFEYLSSTGLITVERNVHLTGVE